MLAPRCQPHRNAWARRPRAGRPAAFARDTALVLGVMALYFLARGLAPAPVEPAVRTMLRVIELEQRLGIFYEPAIQRLSIEHHWMRELANFTYAYLHFPVMAAVGVWLWWHDRRRFRFVRAVLFVSMAIGVLFYYLLPAAPPRLMAAHGYDFGFVDTVFGGGTAVRYGQPELIANHYAAIPSFHFGWIALSAAAIWIAAPARAARVLAVCLTLLMTWAIVASANHLFVDIAAGGAVVLVSWLAVSHAVRRAARRPAPVPLRDLSGLGLHRAARAIR